LVPHVGEDAGFNLKAVAQPVLVQAKFGRARQGVEHFVAEQPGIGADDSIHVVNVFLIEGFGGHEEHPFLLIIDICLGPAGPKSLLRCSLRLAVLR